MIASGQPSNSPPPTSGAMVAPAPQPAPESLPLIHSGPFWPAIDPAAARQLMRLDGTVTAQRLRAALVEAVASVNQQLQTWADQQQADGLPTLADTNPLQIDQASINVIRYQRAVYCYAAANLGERLRNFDTTAEGHKRADAITDPIDDHRRDARWAISDILRRARTVVDLI